MNILEEASSLINGDRQADYGPVIDNFERIADLFTAYLKVEPLTAFDVANLMILVKVARLAHSKYHRDSYVDIAGYAALGERCHEEIEAALGREPVDLDVPEADKFFIEHMEQPRVWHLIDAVPRGVEVVDTDGDRWRWTHGSDLVWHPANDPEWTEWGDRSNGSEPDQFAPFTEVKEPA